MSLDKVFANYKVYGIVIGAFIGIIVYNTIAIDFFARREEIIYTEQLINIFIIMLCNNLKRYIFICIPNFLKHREAFWAVLIFVYTIKFTATLVIAIRLSDISWVICSFRWFAFLIMIMYEAYCKKKYKRLASLSFLVATTFIESFLINIF